jgi:hypothetical protein
MKVLAPIFAVLALLAAGPAPAGQPPKPSTSTDPDHCAWTWQTGGGLGVWTERCTLDTGLWQLKPADDPPWFSLYVDDEDTGVFLAPFAKAADAGIDALLPELRHRGLIPDDDECVFQPASSDVIASIGPTPRTRAYFEIMPTGKRKQAFDATPADEGARAAVWRSRLRPGRHPAFHDGRHAPHRRRLHEPRPGRDDVRTTQRDVGVVLCNF